jgi:hypothetical protein
MGLAVNRHQATPNTRLRHGKLLWVWILPAMPEQIAARQPLPVWTIDRVPVSIASLIRIEQPSPANLVLDEIDVSPLHDEFPVDLNLAAESVCNWIFDVGLALRAGSVSAESRRRRGPLE